MSTCTACRKNFTLAPEDKQILANFEITEPQLCAEDSHRRRMTFRNENRLYKRTCTKCSKPTITVFSPESYVHVYCRACWYSDTWNPLSYAREYDPTRPFLEQFFDLLKTVPQYNLYQPGTHINSDYTGFLINSKNCYLTFSGTELENVVYSCQINWSRDCSDDMQTYHSELLYDCVNAHYCYQGAYLTRCEKSTQCYLGRDLFDCQNCFGCVNIKHKQYYWYNQPLAKEEYGKRLNEALSSRASFEAEQQRFAEFALRYPVEFARIRNSENVAVEAIENSKNIRNCFNLIGNENCADAYRMLETKDSMRINHTLHTEKSYELNSCIQMYESLGCMMSARCNFSAYCFLCEDSEKLFGCVGLRNKKFCILNKQYSEEEYTKLRAQIVTSMKTDGTWGEYLPIPMSPLAYNETIAQDNFPLSETEARKLGSQWRATEKHDAPAQALNLTDKNITDIDESITQHILACQNCQAPYKIQTVELNLLKLLKLPPPTHCPRCRLEKRMTRTYRPQGYQRQCDCSNTAHDKHEGEGRCTTSFTSTFALNRPEKVFCTPCFQTTLQ